MRRYEEKLKAYMTSHGLEAEHLSFEASCHSVGEAARAAGASAEDFVKNICMTDGQGRLIVAIVKGEDRASTKRVAKALAIDRPCPADPAFILEKAGYPIGGVPSFGFEGIFLVDERVMEKKLVYSGGGSAKSLVRIAPSVLLRANGGRVARIRK